jgi:hypothetical protein
MGNSVTENRENAFGAAAYRELSLFGQEGMSLIGTAALRVVRCANAIQIGCRTCRNGDPPL